MPRIDRECFLRLLDAALDGESTKTAVPEEARPADWRVDDAWSLVRRRWRMRAFRATVLERHGHMCVVCGTQMRSVLDAAHIRSYASDPEHRANPANGICLCSFCHTAFDCGDLQILADGSLKFDPDLADEIALKHFTAVPACRRRDWLGGVDMELLRERAGDLQGLIDAELV